MASTPPEPEPEPGKPRAASRLQKIFRITDRGRGRAHLAESATALGIAGLAVAASLGLSMLIILAVGGPPGQAVRSLISGAFGTKLATGATLHTMIPLTLVALGWIVALTAGRINIGFEGQILAGGILATIVGVHLGGLPTAIHLPLALVGAMAAGGVYASIAAWLWARRGVNEIISTLLLNFIAANIVEWLVNGPLQEPSHFVPFSAPVAKSAVWPTLIDHTTLTADVFLVPLAVLAMAFFLSKTAVGFSIRLTGSNRRAAALAGHHTVRMSVLALVLSGCLAGLAGSSLILGGGTNKMSAGFSGGYGFDGIVVALMAQGNPIAVIPAALLFATLETGGPFMQAQAGVSAQLIVLMQGLVILFVTGATFLTQGVGRAREKRLGRTPVSAAQAPL
jgi:general nucleoside transport system permease protein